MKGKKRWIQVYVIFLIFFAKLIIFFLAKNARKDWSKTKKKNLNSSMIELRDQLHSVNMDSEEN